jgi:hypothetical protein
MSGHTIAWTIESGRGVITEATCHEPRGAECHQGRRPGDGFVTHRDIYPECNPILWIAAGDGFIEHYEGLRVPLTDGPITFMWDGDDWTWTYATTEGDDR